MSNFWWQNGHGSEQTEDVDSEKCFREREQRRLRREIALVSISVCTEGDPGLKASALPFFLRLLIPINY